MNVEIAIQQSYAVLANPCQEINTGEPEETQLTPPPPQEENPLLKVGDSSEWNLIPYFVPLDRIEDIPDSWARALTIELDATVGTEFDFSISFGNSRWMSVHFMTKAGEKFQVTGKIGIKVPKDYDQLTGNYTAITGFTVYLESSAQSYIVRSDDGVVISKGNYFDVKWDSTPVGPGEVVETVFKLMRLVQKSAIEEEARFLIKKEQLEKAKAEWVSLTEVTGYPKHAYEVKVQMGKRSAITFKRCSNYSLSVTISDAKSNLPLILSLAQTVKAKKKLELAIATLTAEVEEE